MKSYTVSTRIYGSSQHRTHFLSITFFTSSGNSHGVKDSDILMPDLVIRVRIGLI
jgi:hypothetical protein